MNMINNNLLNVLKTLARKTAAVDDPEFFISDYCVDNCNDAYYIGCDDGEILLARQILKQIG
jgi:hypothetical protein